jgi:anhydro-N-acetylmuramic acid kinase
MSNKEYYSIGQMSGTSLDGVDLVYVKIGFETKHFFEIINYETISYSIEWQKKLANGFHLQGKELKDLDHNYGLLLGEIIQSFIQKHEIKKVDFIASHGHTIFHKPNEGYTLQIGNGREITEVTGIKTICDFRTQDVKLGGQGAPLVPIGDKLLFSDYDYCLNLGGFANVSLDKNKERIAFDICPVNIVLNYYIRKKGFDFDDNGKLAASGKINTHLLSALNQLSFYEKHPPKSLGFEFVQEKIVPIIDAYLLETKDILRTFVEHAALQIGAVLNNNGKCLVTGGGVFNTFLIERIKSHSKTEIYIPSKQIINYKEALIFAFLGYLKSLNQVNCLSSVTGAKQDHSSGVTHLR